MTELATEKLVSVDSHVHFTDEWVKARLRKELHAVWDEANKKAEKYAAKVLRGGQPQLQLEDFVDPEAAKDPGHFNPEGKLKAMDLDGVYAEVIFPELAGATISTAPAVGGAGDLPVIEVSHELSPEEAKQEILEQLQAEGVDGHVDVQIHDNGQERRIEVKVDKQEAH